MAQTPKFHNDYYDCRMAAYAKMEIPENAMIWLGDSIIERTRFKFKGFAPQTQQRQGNIRVSGHVRGRINGIVDAHIEGTVYGQMDAMVSVETEEGEQEDA